MNNYYKSINLQRIGELLVRTLWLEKRLAYLIILKQNPLFKDEFNNREISELHGKLRQSWQKHDFSFVIENFIKEFPQIELKDYRHIENLRGLNALRDLLSHGDISYCRDAVIYFPKSPKHLERFDKRAIPTKTDKDDGTRELNLMDDRAYKSYSSTLNDWEKIIDVISQAHGVNPEKIK